MTATATPAGDDEFKLIYDGRGYEGEMPALELAAVLNAASELAQSVAQAQDEQEPEPPRVRVRALSEGSFEIVMAILQALGPGAGGISLAALMGAAFKFYYLNMRKTVASWEQLADRGTIRVTLANGDQEEWEEWQWRIYNDRRLRRRMKGFAAPLRSGASLRVEAGPEVIEVPPQDAHLLEPSGESVERTDRATILAGPDTISFDPHKKWRLVSPTHGSFSATLEDRAFLNRLARSSVRVGSNDLFRLAVRIVTTERDDADDKVDWFIERVIDHEQGAEQDALPEESDS